MVRINKTVATVARIVSMIGKTTSPSQGELVTKTTCPAQDKTTCPAQDKTTCPGHCRTVGALLTTGSGGPAGSRFTRTETREGRTWGGGVHKYQDKNYNFLKLHSEKVSPPSFHQFSEFAYYKCMIKCYVLNKQKIFLFRLWFGAISHVCIKPLNIKHSFVYVYLDD